MGGDQYVALLQLPWEPYRYRVEILLLPATAGAAGAAFGWAFLHLWALLLPGWPTPMWLHVLLGLAALSGVYASFAQVALRLPITLRILEVFALLALTAVLGLLFSPTETTFGLGEMQFQFVPTAMLLTLFTWLASVYLGVIGPNLLPAPRARHDDPAVRDRLAEMKGEHEVYGRARLERAGRVVWVRFAVLVTFLLAAYIIIHLIFGAASAPSPSDVMFSLSGTLLLASGLSVCALTQLVTRRRMWERDHQIYLRGDVTDVWPTMTAAVAAALVIVALALPANISPLYAIDWDHVMTGVTETLFGGMARDGQPFGHSPPRGAGPQGSRTPTLGGGMPAYDLAVPILILALFALVGRAAWQALSAALGEEALRARGLLRLLAFVVAWPYALVRLALVLLLRALNRDKGIPSGASSGRASGSGQAASAEPGRGDESADLAAQTIRQMYRRLVEQAKRSGHERRPDQTAQEFGQYLASELPELESDIRGISSLYERARYSRRAVPQPMVERFREWWRRTVNTLR